MTALLIVFRATVRRAPLLAPAVGALLLVAATAHAQDDGSAVLVLRGVGVLLACAWLTAVDDPAGELLAASPYRLGTRTLVRAACALAVLLPVWGVSAVVAVWRFTPTPVWPLGVEALALGLCGLALAAGLRAWRGQHEPSHLAITALVAVVLLVYSAPRAYTMMQLQIWGPPWDAARIRWAALAVLAGSVLMLALRDPLTVRRRVPTTSLDEPPSTVEVIPS